MVQSAVRFYSICGQIEKFIFCCVLTGGWIKDIHLSSPEFTPVHPYDCTVQTAADSVSDRSHFERFCLFHNSRVASRVLFPTFSFLILAGRYCLLTLEWHIIVG